jgi:hypothetical protein
VLAGERSTDGERLATCEPATCDQFDPAAFDLAAINARLRQFAR